MEQIKIKTENKTIEQLQKEIYDLGIDYLVLKTDLEYDGLIFLIKIKEN